MVIVQLEASINLHWHKRMKKTNVYLLQVLVLIAVILCQAKLLIFDLYLDKAAWIIVLELVLWKITR